MHGKKSTSVANGSVSKGDKHHDQYFKGTTLRDSKVDGRFVVASREYEEMTLPNFRASGCAVRELKKVR